MKLKRAKAYKKLMSYLHLNFNFREPYQVLVDEEIVLAAVASKYDLVAGFERTLQAKVKVLISQCAIEHLYRAKTPEAKEAVKLAKTFERRRCGHIAPKSKEADKEVDEANKSNNVKHTMSAFECIVECVGDKNKHRYCVATQKPKLRAKFRSIPAVPLIYMNRSVMVMEPMSPATVSARKQIESAKLVQGLNSVAPPTESTGEIEGKPTKSKHETKGPNPLSVKKRQRPTEHEKGDGSGKKRRKRGKRHADEEGAQDNEPRPLASELSAVE